MKIRAVYPPNVILGEGDREMIDATVARVNEAQEVEVEDAIILDKLMLIPSHALPGLEAITSILTSPYIVVEDAEAIPTIVAMPRS